MRDYQQFLDSQKRDYESAKQEILNGKKTGHWIWYIYPQLRGLDISSYSNEKYGIIDLEDAKGYFENKVLKERLLEMTIILVESKIENIHDIFDRDTKKVRSCMTLFYLATKEEIFKKVLDKYYKGELDILTIELLKGDNN